MLPIETDWSFADIEAENPQRGRALTEAGDADRLISALTQSAIEALSSNRFRIGVDSKRDEFKELRFSFQFQVSRDLYDWFLNSRQGYRAHYWSSPDDGIRFNEKIIRSLGRILGQQLGQTQIQNVAKIFYAPTPKIVDGCIVVDSRQVLMSLDSTASKIWFVEELIQSDRLEPIMLPALLEAARGRQLIVPRWNEAEPSGSASRGEGLRAPYPEDDYCWLEVKGGFVAVDGTVGQIKSNATRSEQLHKYGWTWRDTGNA